MIDAVEMVQANSAAAALKSTDRLTGYLVASVAPALFWMLVLSAVSSATGMAVSATAILMTGAAIAAFLGAVYAALASQPAH